MNLNQTLSTLSNCKEMYQLLVKSSISFCSNLYQSNSYANFTTLSDSFCASLIRSVTVKSNNWNLAWSELSYTNFSLESLELHQSLFVKRFIHNSERILCVIKDRGHKLNLWFITWFYISESLHTYLSSNHWETILYDFQKIHDIGYNMDA